MKTKSLLSLLLLCLFTATATAQETGQATQRRAERPERHEPPPQAYEDCKGRKAGDQIQHATPEGKVAATCAESPKGLVARPNQPRQNAATP